MSFRIEEKLYIKKENLIQFQEQLQKSSFQNLYHPRIIESLYFDNINLDMHTDSIEGLTPRKKIRVRKYPDDIDKKLYFEIKNSSIEGRFKTRKIIDEIEFNNKKHSGVFDSQYGVCWPKLIVRYKRQYSKIGDVRVSIDKDIEYIDFKTSFKYKDERVIVELKTNYKKDLDDLANDFPYQRIRFSKYCFGVQNLYNIN
jgi:SPX domain protein involved in polyphosphate accumulation